MSASSGLPGSCPVCLHLYSEHNRVQCIGRTKKMIGKRKYEWVKCKEWWFVCQQGEHDFLRTRKHAYLVCHKCDAHPGGGPAGTGPDGEYVTAPAAQSYSNSGEPEWLWDATYQSYYYLDARGNVIWANQQDSGNGGQ